MLLIFPSEEVFPHVELKTWHWILGSGSYFVLTSNTFYGEDFWVKYTTFYFNRTDAEIKNTTSDISNFEQFN